TDFTLVNNLLFFKVISSFNGLHDEIWITDGQADHTQMVKSFVQGDASYNYHNGGGLLYFVLGNDPLIGNELWRSDGTGDGTYLVKDINPGKSSSFPDDLTFLKGSLLFRAQDFDNGSELWLSNGNGDGTKLLKDINTTTTDNSDAGFMFKGIGVSGNGILFNAFTPKLGGELYKSDGTSAGTVLLNDIATGVDWSYPNNYLSKNKLTYFIADDATGTAIYRTDGTPGGLKRVTAYINRPVYFVVNYNVNDNGLVFYTLGNRSTGALELWRSNGTDAGTFLLTPNLSYYYSNYVEVIGKTVFFVAGDVNTGYELWKSDGTIAGTKMVKDINPGFNGSDPYSFFVYNGTLYFGAYDGQGLGHNSFWKTDGTEKGTVKVKNIEPTFYNPYFNTEPQHVFCVSGGSLYMTATDYNAYGNELWTTNGTEKGTTLVKDINPFGGSFPTNLTDVKGTLFFTAYDGSRGTLLWSTNGTDKSTRLVSDFTGYGANLTSLCSAGGKLYFLNNSFYPTKLWTSDGTAANTKEVTDDGLTALSNYSELTAVGDKLFFGAYSYLYGTEMYAADVTNNKFSAMMVQVPDKLQELPLNFNADVYPNPAHSKATLQLDGEIKNARISIADMYGKKVWQTDLRNEKTIDLPVGTLPAGVYMITIKSEKGARTLRLVKE
ncbi:MAG TPA: ELWxxDGT repeat protein, partial [Flavisolibacter sp.]|nr:ELWxxDGT repeat protein [Flavisolibacter sp.]